MATYRAIASTEVLPKAPVTATLMAALKDNPDAIAEGAASATRIRVGALQRLNAGASIRARDDTVQNTASGSAQTAFDIGFLQKGTVTVDADHKVSAGTGTVRFRRVRNGANVDVEFTTGSTTYVSRTTDINVEPGDLIRVMWWVASGAGNTDIRNIRVKTNGEDLFPISTNSKVEGNTYN